MESIKWLCFYFLIFLIRNRNLHSLEDWNKYKIFFGKEFVHMTDSSQSRANLAKECAMELQCLGIYWTLTLPKSLTSS